MSPTYSTPSWVVANDSGPLITPPPPTTVLTVPSAPTRRTALLNRSATSSAPCASKANATGVSKRSGAGAIGHSRALATGQGAHRAVGTDHPDTVVVGIGHVDLALRVHRDAHRCIEACLRGHSIGIALFTTGQRADLAIGADAADRMVAGVGHVQVALRIGRDARRCIEAGLQRRAINASLALPRYGFDAAIGQAAADPVVVTGIGEVDAAIGTAQQRVRIGKACLRGRAIAVARVAIAGQRFDLRGPRQRRWNRTRRFSQRMQRCLPPGCGQCHYRRQRYACRHPLPPCHRAALPAAV